MITLIGVSTCHQSRASPPPSPPFWLLNVVLALIVSRCGISIILPLRAHASFSSFPISPTPSYKSHIINLAITYHPHTVQISLYGDQCRALYINELKPRPEALQMAQIMVVWMVMVKQTWMQEGDVVGCKFCVSARIGLLMRKCRLYWGQGECSCLHWCCGASKQLRA